MKLVVDMNLSVGWVAALNAVGVEAIHWIAIGPENAPDEAIMAWALSNDAIVLTRDLDFAAALTRQGLSAPSVIQLRSDQIRLERHLPLLQRALSLHGSHLALGAIITIDDERVRVRVLDRGAPF